MDRSCGVLAVVLLPTTEEHPVHTDMTQMSSNHCKYAEVGELPASPLGVPGHDVGVRVELVNGETSRLGGGI